MQPQVQRECMRQLQMWGHPPPEFDLFASEATHICPAFASLLPSVNQSAGDALLMPDWPTRSWLFPPTPLLPRVVARLRRELEQDPSKIFYLVAPLWTSQPWYPLLASMIHNSKRLPERVWFPARPEETVMAKLDKISISVVSSLSHQGRL